jgi:peptidoglycan/xylan/chitin deacetylase (PgdA/CDA1 family)
MSAEPFHYDYAPYVGRPKIVWPNGCRIAFWVIPNIEFYEMRPPPNPARIPWVRPEPDIINYSHRDYGNRVGFHRLAEVMDHYKVRGSVSLNVAVCDHFPDIIETTNRLGWELFSHGIYNTRYLYNLDEDEQRAVIRDARETILRCSGQSLDGWLSPAITNTETTQHVLAEEGIKYTLDLYHDDQPTPLKVRSGRLLCLPYSMEINDTPVMQFRGLSPSEWVTMCKAQFDQLYAEGEVSGTVMCMPLHPYLIGQPHRIKAFAEILGYITGHDGVWCATGREIAAWFDTHYYDAFNAFTAGVAEATR